MAALQQSPIAFHQAKSPPSNRIFNKTLTPKPVLLSFSSSISSLKLAGKTNRRGGNAAGATMVGTAAGSYASAIAEIAKSNGTLEATSTDIEKIEKLFSEKQTYDFFTNPTISIEKKREIIDQINQSLDLQAHMANFLNVLIDSKRIELITDIVKEFEVFYNKMTDTELAIVTSVVQLESQHLAQIAKGVQRLTGSKNVRIKTVIDPSLVAGFTIRYGSSGSKLVDMSVKKQLEEIATQLDFSDISLAV
ncbi:Atp synthase subunit delta protein [Thalictrum thalictroides]|uniref:Atp synthase subunit delta protein n=1 Tax=Thalictrum thalictroides TaxID=46969 RepID=A0A7J6WJ39_THATH|nr:Atp synthase subunit delta protein [Thalictrum thalictroides]